jgi:hypothetical protein
VCAWRLGACSGKGAARSCGVVAEMARPGSRPGRGVQGRLGGQRREARGGDAQGAARSVRGCCGRGGRLPGSLCARERESKGEKRGGGREREEGREQGGGLEGARACARLGLGGWAPSGLARVRKFVFLNCEMNF